MVHPEADQASRELVHHDEDPVALEHDGLATEEVHAPQTVSCIANERQPRRAASAVWPIVFRQDAAHDVLVDVDAECPRHDARDSRAAESGIARLELDDGLDERLVWPLRSRFPRAMARREQATVFATHEGSLKGQECGGTQADGDLLDPSWTQKQ